MGDFRRRPEHRHTIEKPLYPMGAPSSGADATPKGGLRAVLTYTEDCVQPSLFQSLFCTGACETLDVHLFFLQELYLTPVLKFNLMLTCINNPLFFHCLQPSCSAAVDLGTLSAWSSEISSYLCFRSVYYSSKHA